MFEGVVRQVLLGYLGQYIKDIQKEQLKIGLWNAEEVLLENVELILEAFDYLQLPFAIKQGRVGRLSIKIPWKKLGWEPIIIVLEDVFIRACQRDEREWNLDLVERREFAGKKAKLAAAELAKLSRRVCNNQTGQSFISYITAKILDGIQLSIRNVHVKYTDQQIDSAQFVFGIRFSSLTVMKQNSIGTFSAKLRDGQVSKMLEISKLGIYCSTSRGLLHLMGIEDVGDSQLLSDARVGSDIHDYIVAPFDVAVSLVVNRSGKLENGAPQYSIGAELTALVLQLNEIQFKQILILWDYLCTSQLREKYGRYRPSCDSLSRKPKGWQKMWWHYAQESVLSDIRRKLRKTSWKHLGWRISYRRKYVQLYKRKLDFLQQEQPVNEEILRELEQMEKESDIDDILSYRSIAERDLQELLLSPTSPSMGPNGGNSPIEKQQTDERSLGRSRGWLNWLFLGMLGAGETADSSQFSGVISDEVIKDIYEATEFDPILSLDGGVSTKNRILSSIKFNIHQITATLGSKIYDREIVQIIFCQVAIECKQWDESWTILALVNSLDIVDPYAKKNILLTRKAFSEQNFLNNAQPSVSVEVDTSPVNSDTELSLKVVLQPFEVTYDSQFLLNLLDFHRILGSFQSQRERVLSSLNGLEDVNSRLLSKAEYIFLNRTRIIWDVSFSSVFIKIPLKNDDSKPYFMVLELGTLLFRSRVQMETPAPERKYVHDYFFTTFPSLTSTNDISLVVQLQDLYDHFEIVLTDFEVNVTMPDCPRAISIVDRFSASITLASCIIQDESTLKQLEVQVVACTLSVHFSSSIYGAVIDLIESLDIPQSKSELVIQGRPKGSNAFQFSITANVELVSFHANHVGDADNSLLLICALGELDFQYALEEVTEACWVCIKTIKIETGTSNGETSGHILCLSKSKSTANSAHQHGMGVGASIPSDDCGERTASFDGCLLLHYQTARSVDTVCRKLTMGLNEVDLHFYPEVIGLLLQFYDRISQYGSSPSVYSGKNSPHPSKEIKDRALSSGLGIQKFGFSNFYESGSTAASIPLDRFPFITIHNSGSLSSLEQSLIHGIPEWRSTLNLRDTKSVRSPKFNVGKRSRMFSIPTMKFPSNNNASPASGSCNDSDLFIIDLNLSGIRAHFHDSSCILGTLTLPISKSLIIIHGIDYLDLLCSIEGLLLSSSWSSQYLNECLWGSSEANLAPILNIRLRKQKEAVWHRIEISISIQHVCCVLPSEFLAILIGYFSLPDWSLKRNEQYVAENSKCEDMDDNHFDTIYKFEVLDSILILPVESNEDQSLHLKLQQLYCNFTPNSKSEDALKDIPSECVVQADRVAVRVHLLNVFGRGLSLSLGLLKNDGHVPLKLGQDTSCGNVSLVPALDADFWIRIPCENKPFSGLSTPTCIMVKVSNSEVIAEDGYFLSGVEALLKVADQLSSVGRESENFRSDVLQFMQLKRSFKEGTLVLPDASSVTLTEAKCCVDLLTIKLSRSRGRHSNFSELVAKADIQLKCSALFRNEIPLCLDVDISSLSLYSFHTSVVLVCCTSGNSISSCFEIHFSKLNSGENELVVCLPSLDVWLHLSDWGEVLDLIGSYAQQMNRTSIIVESSKNSNSSTLELPKHATGNVFETAPESPRISSSFVSCNNIQESINLVLKSEDVGVSLHFPVLVKEAFDILRKPEVLAEGPRDFSPEIHGEKHMLESEYCKYVTVTLCSRDIELIINERHAKLNCNVEKTSVMLEIIEDQKVISWPFVQFNQINLVAQICDKQEGIFHATAEVRIECLEVWLSHQIFHFWRDIQFKIPETTSSQSSVGSVDFKIHVRKSSLLLTDGRWSCNGPLMEIILRNLVFHVNLTGSIMEASVAGDLLVNYNNIQKVMWEPFIEPWGFQLSMIRKYEQSALLNSSVKTDIYLKSTAHLNLNFTEPLIEVIFRGNEMIKDAWGQVGTKDLPESHRFWGSQTTDNAYTRRYAPYILQNETSLPLLFQVYRGHVNAEDLDILPMKEGNIVQPGSSVPIYIDETPEEQMFRYKPAQSSDRLNEKKSNWVAHHMISVQLDGTSGPSVPISMDLVGLSYFEVDFSKASGVIEAERTGDGSKFGRRIEEKSRTNPNSGFVVPVVFDVSVQRYSKLIRLYSTVILLNATSMPLELRFDIPFGVSPKVLDPIYPGQEFPLPLHLAKAGRMRWRPLGNSYLWSEAHLLSNLLLQENRLGILKSFVCYPSHPSSDPFRCCISIQDISLPSSCGRSSSLHIKETVKQSVANGSQRMHNLNQLKNRAIHYVTLTTPLLVRNHLPRDVSLTIESGGVTRTVFLSEVDTASIFHTDSTHDLGIVFHMHGFKPSISKFPRAETFTTVAKFNETKFSLCETLTFLPDSSDGPLYLTVEKVMDAFCGARELSISVPFLLYNCTGLPLTIAESGTEIKGNGCTIPSCYYLFEEDQLLAREHGLSVLSSQQGSCANPRNIDQLWNSFSKNHTISLRENLDLHSRRFLSRHFNSTDSSTHSIKYFDNHELDARCTTLKNLKNVLGRSSQLKLSEKGNKGLDVDNDSRKVRACMYSPHSSSSGGELMVKLATCLPECVTESIKSSMWSSPFFLVPTSGSTSVVVPRAFTSGAFIISVTSSPVAGPFSGRARAITFQPRYVISNACSKDLCYKQKGTDYVFHLGIGQHAHLHWSDTTRDLLVSLRFNEPGWLWSGSFTPDHLGDTQVKMRNYVSGVLNMIRVEVQNADVSIRDDKIVGSSHGNSGTNLILLSDDNTGFMPYRIDNFSKERLRIYQQKCESFETTVHSYTSCGYAWDEPCYPHRLIVEVPGERVLGSYALDDIKEQIPVYLPSTSEKPGKRLFLSSHAEGAVKVLSIIDSSCHLLRDMKETGFPGFKEKKKLDRKQETFDDYSERISVHISFIGFSLINSYPQELLFACANETKIDILQSVDQQKFSFQISSLQIDNQLHNTPYPVILSFDHDNRSNSTGQMKNKDGSSKMNENAMQAASDSSREPIFCLAAAKWRNKETSLVSFEYISLRLAPLHLELEEEVILGLFDFVRTVISRLQSKTLPRLCSTLHPPSCGANFEKDRSAPAQDSESYNIIKSQFYSINVSNFLESCSRSPPLPSVVPIGAPWQKIYLLARSQTKIYVEVFDLAPIKLTFSFSSVPWMLRNNGPAPNGFLSHVSSTAFQRGLMALADVEGAPVYFKQLTIVHHMASWESFQEILIRHYSRQLLHEMYKVFGSAGVIGNPMGFARNMGLGIRDFLSVPARGILKSPSGLITGVAEGTTSLLSNTVYAISNAATQFSKAAHKSIVAFTFDDQAVTKIEEQRKGLTAHSKGLLNEFLEGLTGFLQSPIRGAEKHGLPGVVSGIALGTAGLVARPVASILDVTGRTAQSIRNRSRLHNPHRFRVRFPRPLARDLPLRPYSWEEAIGTSMLMDADDAKFKDELFVMCKALKEPGDFVIITERHVLVVRCSSLVTLGTPDFHGVAADPEWQIEVEMSLESVIHVDREEEVLNIVGGSSSETPLRQHMQKRGTATRTKHWSHYSTPLPLFQMSMELASKEEAEDVLQVLLSTIEAGKTRGLEVHVLHQSNLR
ncbi:Vacuolar protein sorting-associated protein 13 domain [Macleaya cordata]|uniref:Vacuolar protein sorting-associated protein 13 domain n=1 Tax=Macleaya cordata TaxID=56857 RepID=A0A200QKA1_MACCD|nr:Vacuolar protein sorting-associated protein 13 domain [Macleaya cordata]